MVPRVLLMLEVTTIIQMASPFHILSPANAFALGIALVTLSTSIIMANMLLPSTGVSQKQRTLLTFSIAAMTFYGIRSSMTLQQIFSYIALILVVLFPVVVGYVSFRELVLQGVFYNQ